MLLLPLSCSDGGLHGFWVAVAAAVAVAGSLYFMCCTFAVLGYFYFLLYYSGREPCVGCINTSAAESRSLI
jgi:hypothetical protein